MAENEDQKVYLTEEQWTYVKRHEDERTKETIRYSAASLALLEKGYTEEEKRDWFAGQALAGLLANPHRVGSEAKFSGWAEQAFYFADAMIATRKGGA